MIPAVVLALVLVTPTFSLPISNQEFQISKTQTLQTTTGNVKEEKTATYEDFTNVNREVEKTQNQGYSGVGPTVQQVVPPVQSDTSVQYSEFQTIPQVEKTGVPVPQESIDTSHQYLANYPQNNPTSKGQNVFTSFEHTQPFQTENQVPLSVQPFTIIPDDQVREILQPVVVPSGTVEVEKLVIMAIEPVQQTNFQDVTTAPEKKVPYQQIFQPLTYSTAQNQEYEQTPAHILVQPAEKKDIQTATPTHASVQGQLNQQSDVKEQVVHHNTAVQQPTESVQVYDSSKPTPQIYEVQPNANQIVREYVDHRVSQQSTRTTPQQSQFVQPTSQKQSCTDQQNLQKQAESQKVLPHDTVRNQQVHPLYQQQEYPVVIESVQPHQAHQQNEGFFQKQTLDSIHQQEKVFNNQQPAKKQTPTQQTSDYVLDQNQPPVVQQIRTVQSENHQNQIPVRSPTTVQQQVYAAQPEYLQIHTPSQSQSVEPVRNTYQAVGVVEKQEPVPQVQQNDQFSQVYQKATVQQSDQLSNTRPLIANEAKAQSSNQPIQTGNVNYVSQQSHTNSAVQPNPQIFVATPQQPFDYFDKPVYDFGDTGVSQSTSAPVQVLSVAQNQDQLGNLSVVSSQN